jgi:hypothetical protein
MTVEGEAAELLVDLAERTGESYDHIARNAIRVLDLIQRSDQRGGKILVVDAEGNTVQLGSQATGEST